MNAHDSVHSRRAAILAAAGGELQRARARRIRNARIAAAAAILALGAIVLSVLPRNASTQADPRVLATPNATNNAIDYATVGPRPIAIDFAVVDSSAVPVLDTLTDAEAEEALAESGRCVKIFRVENRSLLVDCTTGLPAVLR